MELLVAILDCTGGGACGRDFEFGCAASVTLSQKGINGDLCYLSCTPRSRGGPDQSGPAPAPLK